MHPEEDNAMEVLVREHARQLPADDVLRLLGTDAEKGLDILEFRARQARFGPNVIPAARGPGPGMRFLLQFHTPLVYILLAAATLWQADMIVMGNSARSVLLRKVLGDTLVATLRDAQIPLFLAQ